MTLEQAIDRYTNNAEYERTHGSLHGCLEFRQLAEWLKDYKRVLEQQPITTTNNDEPITVIYPTTVCDDAISREELLKAIDTWDKFGYTETGCFVREPKGDYVPYIYYDDVIKSIKGMPSVTHKSGKWIPVSERLPEYNGWYQCTANLDDLLLTVDLYYKNGKWLDNRRINMFDTYEIYGYGNSTEKHKLSYEELISEFDWTANVIAWMPLPEPYEPQESEDKE